MMPGARIQAAIELLQEIHGGTAPADRAAAAYFRNRRYIGGKDRRDVLDHAYGVLRRRAALDWWIAKSGAAVANTERARVIAKLLLIDGWTADRTAGSFEKLTTATFTPAFTRAGATKEKSPLVKFRKAPPWMKNSTGRSAPGPRKMSSTSSGVGP